MILRLGALALLAAACDGPHQTVCPGTPVATLGFQAVPSDGGTAPDGGTLCPFDGGTQSFTATLSYGDGTTAYLCKAVSEAAPLSGTRDGGHVLFEVPATSGNTPTCACATQVTEELEGDVGGSPPFQGQLRNYVTSADAGTSCAGDGGASCGVPCWLIWQVTGL